MQRGFPPFPPKPGEILPWEQWQAVIAGLDKIATKLDDIALRFEVFAPPRKKIEEAMPWPEKQPYTVLEYRLDDARNKEEINYPGDVLTVATNGTLAGIEVRLESKENNAVPLLRFNPVKYPRGWEKFYLTNTTQSGKKLWLFIGRAAGASTATSHFTSALAYQAKEDENITGLLASKIRILDIAIQAKQALNFSLMFWKKDTFGNTDLDEDTFIGAIPLDLSKFGKQVAGTGQYYMSLEEIGLDYEDEDETDELHVSLYNADATAKSAGTAGQIVCYFKYELRG